MKVLILGANGFLGPHVVKALEGDYTLRLTDIKEPPDKMHEFIHVAGRIALKLTSMAYFKSSLSSSTIRSCDGIT